MDSELMRLKELLEGKKVLEIKESSQRESICDFVVEGSKGTSSFTLYATDLGAWVGNIQESNSGYKDIQDMFEEMFNHQSSHGYKDEPNLDIWLCADDPMKRQMGFCCKNCEKVFSAGIPALKASPYFKFFHKPETRAKLAKALGDTYVQSPEFLETYFRSMQDGKN
jgi:hypothetical protein